MSRTLSSAIFTHFEKLTDPRIERTRAHKLLDIMTIALCATICGANTWTDVERFGLAKQHWFAKFLELPGGIPSHDTFGRVFAMLDTAEFDGCLRNWLRCLSNSACRGCCPRRCESSAGPALHQANNAPRG